MQFAAWTNDGTTTVGWLWSTQNFLFSLRVAAAAVCLLLPITTSTV